MRAADTNVLVRYLMQDDPRQVAAADAVLREPCFVADTVLVELAWILSSAFRLSRAPLAAALARLVELPSIAVAEPALVAWAIDRFAAGGDFADMMHLIASRHADGFATFDRALAEQAGPRAPNRVETLG